MTKPMESCFKLLFLPNPSLDLCQTLNSLCLEGVENSLQISTSSGLL
jgi:hypothetical protein